MFKVPCDVEQAELKKAYYKRSLQWHPDKNTLEDTTCMFQQIQEAYKVLSDPYERAWYDKHRAQILQGGGLATHKGNSSTYEEERVNVFEYFRRSCYDNFDDGAKGFYTVYRKVFDDIADEEERAAEFSKNHGFSSTDDDGNDVNFPSFGFADSLYSKCVAPFYEFWETFETKKSYTWVELYDTRCAGSRPERRAMEAENRRLCNAAIRKRNEEIHQLVAYVKKRDMRVIAERERIQLVEREKQIRNSNLLAQTKERDAIRLAEAWKEEISFGGLASKWSSEVEAELARIEAQLDGDLVDNDISNEEDDSFSKNDDACSDGVVDIEKDDFYCIVCDKMFNSIKAKSNHDMSKKHKKQFEALKKVLIEQNDKYQVDLTELLQVADDDDDVASNLPSSDKSNKRAKRKKRKKVVVQEPLIDDAGGSSNKAVEGECTEEKFDMDDLDELKNNCVKKETNQKPSLIKPGTKQIKCDTCLEEFSSKNALFKHLEKSGHATLKITSSKRRTKQKH